jgi:hypothetical protein
MENKLREKKRNESEAESADEHREITFVSQC